MEQLTSTQAKQVLAFFGQRAAEEAPADLVQDDAPWDTHAWKTLYTASLAIGRRITEHDWHTVIVSFLDLQSYDRDPDAYLHERGYVANDAQKWYMKGTLEDLVSWAIDTAYNTSQAA